MHIPRIKEKLKRFYRKYIYTTALYDVDLEKKVPKTHKALVIYSNQMIRLHLNRNSGNADVAKTHSGFWESVEMVRLLNKYGYTVDCLNYDEKYEIDFSKYSLVLDSADNLKNIPHSLSGNIIKIYYATSCHWLYFRESELRRVRSLYEREGILIPPERSIKPFLSEQYADYITTFGGTFIKSTFLQPANKFYDLYISVSHEPNLKQLPAKDPRKFVWMAGAGPFHKGLDLAINAFERMPDYTLHVIGDLGPESTFKKWVHGKAAKHDNIQLHGFMDVTSKDFEDLVYDAVGNIFPSSSEGGAGSAAQLLHFGVIPILTASTCALQDESICFKITTEDPVEIIDEICRFAHLIARLPPEQISSYVADCIKQAKTLYTREGYSSSLEKFLQEIHAGKN
jgi:hypothetical protein